MEREKISLFCANGVRESLLIKITVTQIILINYHKKAEMVFACWYGSKRLTIITLSFVRSKVDVLQSSTVPSPFNISDILMLKERA